MSNYKQLKKSKNTLTVEMNEITLNDDDNDIKYDNNSDNININDSNIPLNPIVRLRNVHKTYLLGLEGVPALRGVSLTINEGEFIVILGKSGGGKTSMLNIMGTIDKPTKGDLYIDGKRISNKTSDREVALIRLKKIGFCFQTFNLISSMTALENVELPMILDGELNSKEIRERAMKLLTQVGLKERYNHLPSQLSGGEQQRVTISRAIANKPKLLLLDEPTGDLDTKNSNIVMDLLINLNIKERITCVFVTHDVGLKYFADKVIHMLDGKINKIEYIDKNVKKDAINELKHALNNKQKKEKIKIYTEIREPNNYYEYLKFKNKLKQNNGNNILNTNNITNNKTIILGNPTEIPNDIMDDIDIKNDDDIDIQQ